MPFLFLTLIVPVYGLSAINVSPFLKHPIFLNSSMSMLSKLLGRILVSIKPASTVLPFFILDAITIPAAATAPRPTSAPIIFLLSNLGFSFLSSFFISTVFLGVLPIN